MNEEHGEIIESKEEEMLFILAAFLTTLGIFGFLHNAFFHKPVFNLFHVSVLQSFLYVVSGGVLFRSLLSIEKEKLTKFFSLFYGILAIIGLFFHGNILGLLSFEKADVFLYGFLAITFFYIQRLQSARKMLKYL